MSLPKQTFANSHSPARALIIQRTDTLTAVHVDAGLSLQHHFGTNCALEYLRGQGVSAEISQRVLLHPDQRRQAE